MIRVRWRLAAAAFGVVVFGVVVAPTRAGATPVSGTVTAVGWWTNRPGAQPSTAAGGFEVALDSSGSPESIAAIAVTVDPLRLMNLRITLSETASIGATFSHLQICRATPGWAPANPGDFATAPHMDCAGAVDLTHTGSDWVGDITKMLPNGGRASLGVVGVRDQQAPVNFLVEVSGVSIAGTGTPTEEPSGASPPQATATDGSGSAAASTGFGDFTSAPIAGFDTPSTAPVTATQSATATSAPPSTTPSLAAGAGHNGGPSRPWLRLIFLTPLSAALGVGLVYARRFLSARGMNLS